MIGFFLNPVGRFLAGIGAVLVTLAAIYGKGRRDARQKQEAQANADALDRTQAAVRAGDAAAIDAARLRGDDGHRRD